MPPKKTAATVSSTPAPPKPYLLSSKTRAQLAASQPSSVPLAPVGVMAESSPPSAMPVPLAPVIVTSVPSVPESSPFKKADLNELAASAAKNLVNILASPSSHRSASVVSSVTSLSPASVGGNSRASISPGESSPSLEMQQMMQMMQQQMKDMMKNVELNVMRSINDVSNDVMKRVTVLMDQHDAELTSKVRRMVNDAKTYIPAPFITLEDNTTLHDYAEEENPSLHGSRNEGFSYKASENDEDDSENE